ncbi:MAG: DUF4838 domain-containing protein [Alistipes sp.]|nr:DUF4838 domain-containing protein [Alistipes sp.]
MKLSMRLVALVLPWMPTLLCAQTLHLVRQGHSAYRIVVPVPDSEMEQKAAAEFQRLLALSTQVALPIVGDTLPVQSREIRIGALTRREAIASESDLQEDGFALKSSGKALVIRGGRDKGLLYGVYTFFDRYLGYRCYTPTVLKYPTYARLDLQPLDTTEIPVNTYRNVYYAVAEDPFYADWHKLDHMKPEWEWWVHTFSRLLPPSQYFESHPEYYAWVDGKRVGMQADGHLFAQLCLTNPGTLQTSIETLRAQIQAHPQAHYWSISQNDTYPDRPYNCTCPDCAALDRAAGSPSGSMLHFVNRIAEAFPDKTISTLAYRYTRKAPKGILPNPNVNIMLCDIECNRQTPVFVDSTGTAFCSDFEAWSNLTHNILVWDYTIQFSNLMDPFPNLHVLQPNLQYFVKHGVSAHFQQGNISRGGEFSELRPYLIARLLWNPDLDFEAELNDFLQGYYEEGGAFIAQYIQIMRQELDSSHLPLTIYGKPTDHLDGFLSDRNFARYEALFDQAERAVADKPEVLERVQTARMPLTFALMEIAKARGKAETRVLEQRAEGWGVKPEVEQRLQAFLELCHRTGVQNFVEGGRSADEYVQMTRDAFTQILTQ